METTTHHQQSSDIGNREPAIESADYPGCYYRIVDGETEWLNPPMEDSVEYRTVERYEGNPVYVIQTDCGAAIDGKEMSIDGTWIVRIAGRIGVQSLPFIDKSIDANWYATASVYNNNFVRLYCGASHAAYSTWIQTAWYIKE